MLSFKRVTLYKLKEKYFYVLLLSAAMDFFGIKDLKENNTCTAMAPPLEERDKEMRAKMLSEQFVEKYTELSSNKPENQTYQ